MTTKTMVQINKVIHCQLQLEDGTDFTIPMRNDGYIYATKLCRVGGKLVADWLRLEEVKQLITKVQDKLDTDNVIWDTPYPQKMASNGIL